MKRIIIFAVAIVFSAQVKAQSSKVENPNAPKFSFTNETIDYGEIKKGADGVRYFDFVNEGKEPLIISKVKSSCGCTIPVYPKAPIAPGESSQIKVKYNTSRVGPFRKTITISSNALNSSKTLTIKGKVLNETKK